MTNYTINDYFEQVKALRDLGQKLIDEQHDNQTNLASWVNEVEVMNEHLECCLLALARACNRKAMVDRVARVYGTTHAETVRFATLCESYPNIEAYDRMIRNEYATLMNRGPFLDE